jgi:hypothetical protein
MPSRETLAYARPLCHHRRVLRNGQHGWHLTCYQPMRYVGDAWWCQTCGKHTTTAAVVARPWNYDIEV